MNKISKLLKKDIKKENLKDVKSLLDGFKNSPEFDNSSKNCQYIANLLYVGKSYGLEIYDFQRYSGIIK